LTTYVEGKMFRLVVGRALLSFGSAGAVCKLDVVFAVDASQSFGLESFNMAKAILNELTIELRSSAFDTRIALMTFSRTPTIVAKLDEITSTSGVLNAIQGLQFIRPSATDLKLAFSAVKDSILVPAAGDRPDAKNVIVLLSDGINTVSDRPEEVVNKLKAAGVTLVTHNPSGNGVASEFVSNAIQGQLDVAKAIARKITENAC